MSKRVTHPLKKFSQKSNINRKIRDFWVSFTSNFIKLELATERLNAENEAVDKHNAEVTRNF